MNSILVGMEVPSPQSHRGRPRSFDCDAVLEAAMHVFWQKGFEETSLADLTEAMGINKPSLYAAFGNKEQLYLKVLDRYGNGPSAFVDNCLAEPNVREAVRCLLRGSVDANTTVGSTGCLMVKGRLTCSGSDKAGAELADRHACMLKRLKVRFNQASAEGQLSADANAADLAGYVMSVISGISVEAASGISRARLRRVAELAVDALPCV